MPAKRVLILGGTAEARQLADALSREPAFAVITSLAGRTSEPSLPESEIRIGGFGGVEGMSRYLADERIELVVDATHPFAAAISRSAFEACKASGVRSLHLVRPAWVRQLGDAWTVVPDIEAAAQALQTGQRAFLTIGSSGLQPFADRASDIHFIARMIESPNEALPEGFQIVRARPPFSLQDESAFLRDHAIDVLVTKNAGGTSTYAKIEAARHLSLPVIIVDRPRDVPDADADTVEAMLDLMRAHAG